MSAETRRISRILERVVERAVQKISLDVTANLIETTPVDTGWARANWVPAVGVPFEGTAGSRAEAERGRVSFGAQAAGQGSLAAFRINDQRAFVSNNVPYITKLNDGSSAQAPAGFVQAAIGKALTQDLRSLG